MKKILIVDDTPVNLEAARAYFSQNKNYEFLYATNRKEAEKLLPECDALITDAQMPFDENSVSFYEANRPRHHPLENLMASNGYLLTLEAFAETKPSVLLSYHGDSLTLLDIRVNNIKLSSRVGDIKNENVKEELFEKELPGDAFKELIGKEIPASFSLSGKTIDKFNIIGYINSIPYSISSEWSNSEDLRKDNSSGWEIGFRKISEQLKLSERPIEIQKIKLK